MSIKEFEFVAARQRLMEHKAGVSSQVRYEFMHDCERLGIKPTIPRLLDWCDHWMHEYMQYSLADDDTNKPFNAWHPKRAAPSPQPTKESKEKK